MSPSLIVRPPAAIGTLRMSSRFVNWPLTRTKTRSWLVSIEPAGHHRVLALQALGDGERRDAERGQALVRELHVHLLLLLAQEVDLLHVGRLEQAALDVLGDVGQLRVPDAVTLDGIEQRVDVAVLVVEDRADDAVGQFELEVRELLARLVPGFLLVLVRRAALHGDRHAAVALARKGDDLLEVVELLELLFHAVQDLVLDLLCARPGPDHGGRHRRHRELGVLQLAELGEAEDARDRDHDDQEEHHGAVPERPFGEVEVVHRAACCVLSTWVRLASASAAPGSATFSPGAIFCTPAVTTCPPAGTPETSARSLR